jgi:hypothetical protein
MSACVAQTLWKIALCWELYIVKKCASNIHKNTNKLPNPTICKKHAFERGPECKKHAEQMRNKCLKLEKCQKIFGKNTETPKIHKNIGNIAGNMQKQCGKNAEIRKSS